MSRLTRKFESVIDMGIYEFCHEGIISTGPHIDKLGQLEDLLEKYNLGSVETLDKDLEICHRLVYEYGQLEEELGTGLITLFKLIKSKKVYSFSNNGIARNDINVVNIYTNTITIWNGVCKVEYPLSEYGKSFALTKEELE